MTGFAPRYIGLSTWTPASAGVVGKADRAWM